MTEPETVAVELDFLKQIRRALKECSEDLECALDVEYPKAQREQYDSYMRRYNNNMEPVLSARDCLAQLSLIWGLDQ